MLNSEYLYKNFAAFGISKKEAIIYLFLLNRGEHTSLEISRNTKLPKSTVYFYLDKLIENGLIVLTVYENTKKYSAYPVSALQELVSQEDSKLEEMNRSYKLLEDKLRFDQITKQKHTRIRFYQDISGLKQIIWNALYTKELAQCITFKRVKLFGERFYIDYASTFRNKGIKQRSLINPDPKTFEYIKNNQSSPKVHSKIDEIKCISETDFKIEYDTLIYDNIYACIMWLQDELVGFEIENETFVKAQQMLFNLMWKKAKPLTK